MSIFFKKAIFVFKITLLSLAGGVVGFLYSPEPVGGLVEQTTFSGVVFIAGIVFSWFNLFDKGMIAYIKNGQDRDKYKHRTLTIGGLQLIDDDISFVLGTVSMFVVHTIYSIYKFVPVSKLSIVSCAGIIGLTAGAWLRNKVVKVIW